MIIDIQLKRGFGTISFLSLSLKVYCQSFILIVVGTPYANSINLHSHVSWHLTNWIIFGCCMLPSIPYLLITFVNNILSWFLYLQIHQTKTKMKVPRNLDNNPICDKLLF